MSSQGSRDPEGKAVFHIDPEVENGTYCNGAHIIHSPNEFLLDFILSLPGGKRKVVARILTSPSHAKQLAEALQRNLEKYESSFGPITPPKGGTPEFSGPVQ